MNAIADRYADQDVGSIFLYTNEAHPGENYPHHRSMEQKQEHAKALRDVLAIRAMSGRDSFNRTRSATFAVFI